MSEAWIRAECPDCGEHWEANPTDLPPPGQDATCQNCGAIRPVSELMATQRSLDVLEQFHA